MEAIRVVVASLHEKVKAEGVYVSTAIFPLLKLLSLTIIGLILAHPRVQLIPRSTYKLLSKLVFALFLPCLIFTHLGPSITLKNFLRWWFLPVNVLISTVIGCVLGYLVALLCQPPPEFFRFTIIMTGFGNTGNIALAIVGSVCHDPDNPFGSECKRSGMAYVSLTQWVAVILVYTFVYHMMEPPLEYYEIVEDEEDEIVEVIDNSNASMPLLVEAEWPGMEAKATEHCKTPFIARLFNTNSESNISDRSIPDLESIDEGRIKSIRCLAEPKVVRKIRVVAEKTPIQHILQPPTIASFLAILVGIIPQVKSAIYGEDAALDVLTGSLDILAEAALPFVMLILGGMLAEGPKDSRLGMRTTVGIIVTRLLVLPVAGIGVICLADKWHLLVKDDRLYLFVLLLQYTTPSAILLAAVASLRGYAVREASALLFWQHVFALFSLSLYIIVYFNLILPYV